MASSGLEAMRQVLPGDLAGSEVIVTPVCSGSDVVRRLVCMVVMRMTRGIRCCTDHHPKITGKSDAELFTSLLLYRLVGASWKWSDVHYSDPERTCSRCRS
jgi:hypothetical protein